MKIKAPGISGEINKLMPSSKCTLYIYPYNQILHEIYAAIAVGYFNCCNNRPAFL